MNNESNWPPQAPIAPPAEPAGDGAAGAPPSNTAPPNCSSGGTRIVGAGIDSLYLSVPGVLSDTSQSQLDRLKEMAQSPVAETRALAQHRHGDWCFGVSDRGARRFSYVLTDPRFRIELARSTAKRLPMAYVQVSSAALAELGPRQAVADLLSILGRLGEIGGEPTISRADLFVDATTTCDLSRLEDEQWVTRAHSKARYSVLGARTGYVVGQGGDVSLRAYVKTLEIQRSGKTHATRAWRLGGWNGADTVWRVEIQIRRNALEQFSVWTLADLETKAASIWRYALEDWCRLCVINPEDKTPSRWLTHPFWLAAGGATAFGQPSPGGRRTLRRSRAPSDLWIAKSFIADLTSFMAKYEIFDTSWAIEDMVEMTKVTLAANEDAIGASIGKYIARSVATKTRDYATGAGFRVPPEIPIKLFGEPRQRHLDDDEEVPF